MISSAPASVNQMKVLRRITRRYIYPHTRIHLIDSGASTLSGRALEPMFFLALVEDEKMKYGIHALLFFLRERMERNCNKLRESVLSTGLCCPIDIEVEAGM